MTPASSNTMVERPRPRAADRPYTIASAPSDPAKLASGTAEIDSSVKSARNVIAIMAPRAAPAETPSVSGEASGFLSSA